MVVHSDWLVTLCDLVGHEIDTEMFSHSDCRQSTVLVE